jgi:hypothetical protein
MSRMFMGMDSVLPGVVMIVNVGIPGMAMRMGMLMDVFMGVGVSVFMIMDRISMGMRMTVHMGMLM